MNSSLLKWILVLVIFALAKSEDVQLLLSLSSAFEMKHPFLINSSSSRNHAMNWIKTISSLSQYSRTLLDSKENHVEDYQNIVAYSGSNFSTTKIEKCANRNMNGKLLIIWKENIKRIRKINLNIGQEVYFYLPSTSEVHEFYTINGLKISRSLGYFNRSSNTFEWAPTISQNILIRRANFHGLTLRGMVETMPEAVYLHENYEMKAKFFSQNETFLVNGLVGGAFIDILDALEDQLNFTTNIYKRLQRSFGMVNDWNNGTITATGMVGDIYFRRAEIIATSIHIIYKRALYIDFLPPILPLTRSMFIPKGASIEQFQFLTYFWPFKPILWIMIFIFVSVIGIFKLLIQL